ncbi:unnamed protein product [Rotaria socialis]|uniref:Uncharacterized protein n=1 Tax=Rotaria socialis TaxID=392032 RepID=A0A820WR78_9BILA|nr:unnamed protein product [Rotaria socialis]
MAADVNVVNEQMQANGHNPIDIRIQERKVLLEDVKIIDATINGTVRVTRMSKSSWQTPRTSEVTKGQHRASRLLTSSVYPQNTEWEALCALAASNCVNTNLKKLLA